MSPLFTAVCDAFSRAGWMCRPVKGIEVVEADFEAHHAKICLHVQVFAELDTVSVVAEAPLRGRDPAVLARLAELFMRANRELSLGAFEMDWDAGRALFRLSNIFPPGRYDGNIIASLVHTTVVEMDRITPCIAMVETTPRAQLADLDLAALLAREDLLPVAGEGNG